MKKISNNESLRSCDGLANVLKAAFPDSKIASTFTLERTKAAYLITDAIGPHFRMQLIKDIDTENYYSILFDETTNSAKTKELQISIRYFSKKLNHVEFRHLETFFIGSATGNILFEKIVQAIQTANLPLSKLLMLGMDGPNVNKNVRTQLNDKLIEIRGSGLLDVGSCNLHVLHNSFHKGLSKYGMDVADLMIQVYNYFDGYASRNEDFIKFCKIKNLSYYHLPKYVPSRWLAILVTAETFLKMFEAVKSYFLHYLPKKHLFKPSNHYNNIKKYLMQEDIMLQLLTIIESANMFTKFLHIFQKTEPMIHLLHSYIISLLKLIATIICLSVDGDANTYLNEENLLLLKNIDLPSIIIQKIKDLKFNELSTLKFRKDYQKHFLTAGQYLISHTNFNIKVLEYFKFLDPKCIKKLESISFLKSLIKLFPNNSTVFETNVIDEFKLLQFENLGDEYFKYIRIDEFWFNVLNRESVSYKNLQKFVKSILSVSHGQGDVERGFSSSSHILTEERASMNIRSFNARINALDGIRRYDSIETIPIDDEFIKSAHSARKNYFDYLQTEKEKKLLAEEKLLKEKKITEEEKEKNKQAVEKNQKLVDYEASIIEKEKKLVEEQKLTDAMYKEASNKLNKCIESGDLLGAKVAQSMFASAIKNRETEKEQLNIVNKLKRKRESLSQEIINLHKN